MLNISLSGAAFRFHTASDTTGQNISSTAQWLERGMKTRSRRTG